MRNRPYVRKMLKNPGDLWRRSPADVKLTYPSENGNPTWLFDTQMICSGISGDVGLNIPGCQPSDLFGATEPKGRVEGGT